MEPLKEDQAPSAILELVDGPKDMRMALTAKTIAHIRHRAEEENREFKINDMTAHNIKKVTQFRKDGTEDLKNMVQKFAKLLDDGDEGVEVIKKKRVYPKLPVTR